MIDRCIHSICHNSRKSKPITSTKKVKTHKKPLPDLGHYEKEWPSNLQPPTCHFYKLNELGIHIALKLGSTLPCNKIHQAASLYKNR